MSECRKISELLNSYFVSVFSEEEGGDLLKSSFSFPGTPEEELGTDTSLRIWYHLCTRGWAQLRDGAQEAALGYGLAPAMEPATGSDSGQKTLSKILLGISHLLYKVGECKGKS